jgi:hypothetical protein
MNILDRAAATAGRTAAAVAALAARLPGEAVAAATGAATGAVQAVFAGLRAAGTGSASVVAPGAGRRMPAPAPVAPAAQQPPADPATVRPRASARGTSSSRIQKPRAAAARSTTTGRTTRPVRRASAASPADIRAWAAANGYEVASRGRVSEKVRQAYAAAH